MCSMIDSGEKGYKLPEQNLFNSLVLYLTLESYMIYEKEHEVAHCHQLCLLLVVFCCQYIKASLKRMLNLLFLSFCIHIISCCIQKKETGLLEE